MARERLAQPFPAARIRLELVVYAVGSAKLSGSRWFPGQAVPAEHMADHSGDGFVWRLLLVFTVAFQGRRLTRDDRPGLHRHEHCGEHPPAFEPADGAASE